MTPEKADLEELLTQWLVLGLAGVGMVLGLCLLSALWGELCHLAGRILVSVLGAR